MQTAPSLKDRSHTDRARYLKHRPYGGLLTSGASKISTRLNSLRKKTTQQLRRLAFQNEGVKYGITHQRAKSFVSRPKKTILPSSLQKLQKPVQTNRQLNARRMKMLIRLLTAFAATPPPPPGRAGKGGGGENTLSYRRISEGAAAAPQQTLSTAGPN